MLFGLFLDLLTTCAPLQSPMPLSLILTHPGGSHKYEPLACLLLAAVHHVPIVRPYPTPNVPAAAVRHAGAPGTSHELLICASFAGSALH